MLLQQLKWIFSILCFLLIRKTLTVKKWWWVWNFFLISFKLETTSKSSDEFFHKMPIGQIFSTNLVHQYAMIKMPNYFIRWSIYWKVYNILNMPIYDVLADMNLHIFFLFRVLQNIYFLDSVWEKVEFSNIINITSLDLSKQCPKR